MIANIHRVSQDLYDEVFRQPFGLPPSGKYNLPDRYTQLQHMKENTPPTGREKFNISAHSSSSRRRNYREVTLSTEELAFLLGEYKTKRRKRKKESTDSTRLDTAVSLLGLFNNLLPRKPTGYALLCLLLFTPLLGNELFRHAFGAQAQLVLSIVTALIGIILIRGQGRGWLNPTIKSIQEGRVPPYTLLHKGMLTLGGLFFLLPGPVMDILALLLVFPPSSRLCTVLIARKLHNTLN